MTALPVHHRSDNVRGILAMLAAMVVFVINDTLVKLAAAHVPTGEAIFLRGLFTTVFCAALIVANGLTATLPHALSLPVLARAVTDVGAAVFFLTALVHMQFADAFGILQFTPLAITAAAAVFLGARVGWRRWLATGVGLVGVLLILRPGGTAFSPFAVFAIASIAFSVARDLLTRVVGIHVPSLVLAGAASAAIMLASLGFLAFERWHWPQPLPLVLLIGASAALLAGHHWLIVGLRAGEIAVVAPFRYTLILWAIASGFVVWGEVPDLAAWIGIVIVSAAGLYTFLREQRLSRLAPCP